ncbi:MAG: hypothetical protein QXV73_05180 [Candidatus Micrarchaeia archaeon]
MKLSYKTTLDTIFNKNIRRSVDAEVKKENRFIRVKLSSGGYLSRLEWFIYNYRIEECTDDEYQLMKEWLKDYVSVL